MITVMTPTYNRAYILENCYKSLLKQSNKRFKWMIIDDGSTDNTSDLVKKWIEESIINIDYIKKTNGGKASALNVGIDKLDTDYAVCLDSDDVFFENTIELAEKQLTSINDQNCCGILALRNNPDGTVMGNQEIPRQYIFITAADVFLNLNLTTELICFYKSNILKQYRFPSFEGEKFVSPAWIQYEITKKYKFKTSWDKLCECEYVTDGLTKNKKKIIQQNPLGYSSVKLYSFNQSPSLKLRIKHGIMYDCGCLIANNKNWLNGVEHKCLAKFLMPIAFLVKKIRFE